MAATPSDVDGNNPADVFPGSELNAVDVDKAPALETEQGLFDRRGAAPGRFGQGREGPLPSEPA